MQIGLTATPVSSRDADTYGYFGEPLYEYSLARGIEDGFLAPYRVRKVRLNVDMTGWRPAPGQKDLLGREVPDKLYGPKEYEGVLAILDRTEEAARYLTDFLHRTDRMGKTIVFCANSDRAFRMTKALHNANADLVRRHGDRYVCRITAADGVAGRERLDEFRREDTDVPVIAVTSRLLSTGVDIPTLRNIVLFRVIRSMPEFKQIIRRGTRLFPEAGKFSFDIIDFVEATRLFNDPGFDGPPMRVVRDETDTDGNITDSVNEDVPAMTRWSPSPKTSTSSRTEEPCRRSSPTRTRWRTSSPIRLSPSERARRVAVRHRDFLGSFAPKAREVLDRVLDQYAAPRGRGAGGPSAAFGRLQRRVRQRPGDRRALRRR